MGFVLTDTRDKTMSGDAISQKTRSKNSNNRAAGLMLRHKLWNVSSPEVNVGEASGKHSQLSQTPHYVARGPQAYLTGDEEALGRTQEIKGIVSKRHSANV